MSSLTWPILISDAVAIRAVFLLVVSSIWLSTGCTSDPVSSSNANSACANIDWYEAGRSDGVVGGSLSKLASYRQRCDGTPAPVKADLYTNGRDAGLIDFCSATGGLEAGKGGIAYEKVCPDNLEPTFLSNYDLGRKIRELETENSDLESRIDNLNGLLSPTMSGGSVRAQIDQLKERQARINAEISTLESKAASM